MKAKEKKEKHIIFSIKNLIYFFSFIIIILYLYIFYNKYFPKNEVYAKETSNINTEEVTISNAKAINLDEIISKNSNEGTKEEYYTEEVELEYITKYNTNSELPKGIIQVVQEGREGKQEIVKKRIYQNDEIISEEQISTRITKAAINKIVEIGGGAYKSNYTVKNGDKVYVTSDRLSVYAEPSEDSVKVATLNRNEELYINEIIDSWYKISTPTVIGYVKSEATTYINPNTTYEEQAGEANQKEKSELISNLSFNMVLNKPSGLSLEQFKKVLSDEKDVNKIFEKNAQYFYYIEKQYNINGIFVAAVGIHESAWGTSKIAKEKNNLFGYGAYDSNPYNGAYSFSDYSESIDLVSRVFVKYYLNPKGTNIYDGEKAMGTYYNGPTLTGVNTKYASDKNWANGVYNHMKYLYNKL